MRVKLTGLPLRSVLKSERQSTARLKAIKRLPELLASEVSKLVNSIGSGGQTVMSYAFSLLTTVSAWNALREVEHSAREIVHTSQGEQEKP